MLVLYGVLVQQGSLSLEWTKVLMGGGEDIIFKLEKQMSLPLGLLCVQG